MAETRGSDAYRTARLLMEEKRFTEAYELYLQLGNQGDPSAQVHLGWMHQEGVGVPRDKNLARKWFLQAATLGSVPAAFYCGRAAVADQDWPEAIKWFREAGQREYGPALLWCGLLFIRGYGVPVDLEKGIAYLKRGAFAGNFYARRELAKLMIQGKLGLNNIPLGFALFARSAVIAAVQYLTGPHDDKLIG